MNHKTAVMGNRFYTKQFRNSIEIKDIDDYNDICQDMLSDFVDNLIKDDRYIDVDFPEDEKEYPDMIYFNHKGMRLLERYKSRLWKLGESMFDKSEMDHFHPNPNNLIES